MWSRSRLMGGVFSLVSAAACTGAIGTTPPDSPAPGTPEVPGAAAPRGEGNVAGGSAAPPGSSPPPVTPAEPVRPQPAADPTCTGAPTFGPSVMRRLTAAEHARTVRDLLALAPDAPLPAELPADSRVDGFDNNAFAQSISAKHVEAQLEAADGLVPALLASTDRRTRVVGCAPTGAGRAACLAQFADRFGRRAFRRPLTADEKQKLLALAATAESDADPYAAIGLMTRALLAAPSFLFLEETGVAAPERAGAVRLTGFEVLARLSFLLWGRGPDDRLLDAAAAGKLDSAAGIGAVAAEMLADPRAADGRRAFYQAWLGLDELAAVERDKAKFPLWSEGLRTAMRGETERFMDEVLGATGDLRALVSAPWTFVDDRLAKLYAVTPAPAAGTWRRHTFTNDERGAGLLTQASFLTTAWLPSAATPVVRGKAIRQRLLCLPLPPPPDEVPPIADAKVASTATERERLAAHTQVPACSGCHALIDPLGFGLARHDGLGAYRKTDAQGRTIDARGSVPGVPGSEFDGATQLGAALARMPELSRCAATQLYRWAMARSERPEDACQVRKLADALAGAQHSFPALVAALVASDAFRYRIPAAGGDR